MPIYFLIEIKKMYFQHRFASVANRRACSQTSHARQAPIRLLTILISNFHHENTTQGRMIMFQTDVGRWKADFFAQLVTINHTSADAVVPPQHSFCQWQIAARKRLPDGGAGYTQSVYAKTWHDFKLEAIRLRRILL